MHGCRGAGAYVQQSLWERQGTHQTGLQSKTGPHKDDREPLEVTLKHSDSLEFVNASKLTSMCWSGGGNRSI